MNESATHVVVQTPRGRGAVATVLVEGPQALEFVAQSFHPRSKQPLDSFPLGRIIFGTWLTTVQDSDDASQSAGEELVVCRLDEHRIEVHCHGSLAAIEQIVASLTTQGAVSRNWQDHARAKHNDALVAEAHVALAAALTDREAGILLDQANGALSKAVREIECDLSEGRNDQAIEQLQNLLQFASLGLHLTRPWNVVLSGPPNVGKSSLMNRLLGYERAIVFDQPGTTRDVVTSSAAIDGWPVELADTAGLRESRDTIEHEGITRAREHLSTADIVLLVSDASATPGEDSTADVPEGIPHLRVLNKVDLLPQPPATSENTIATSAVSGVGIEQLRNAIVTRLVPRLPGVGDAVPFTPSQVEVFQKALKLAQQGEAETAQRALAALNSIENPPSSR